MLLLSRENLVFVLDLSDTSSQLVEAVGPGNSLWTNHYKYVNVENSIVIIKKNSIIWTIEYCEYKTIHINPYLTTSSVLWIFVCIDPNRSVPNLLRSLAHKTYSQSPRPSLWVIISSFNVSKNKLNTLVWESMNIFVKISVTLRKSVVVKVFPLLK